MGRIPINSSHINSILTGRWGETIASRYLKSKGYKVTAMGYRTRLGEIDIIAEDRRHIVFVEVKLRKNADFGSAMEFVGREKQRRLNAAAGQYLASNPTAKQPRFDVIEVYAPDGTDTAEPEINHIENAFGGTEY